MFLHYCGQKAAQRLQWIFAFFQSMFQTIETDHFYYKLNIFRNFRMIIRMLDNGSQKVVFGSHSQI